MHLLIIVYNKKMDKDFKLLQLGKWSIEKFNLKIHLKKQHTCFLKFFVVRNFGVEFVTCIVTIRDSDSELNQIKFTNIHSLSDSSKFRFRFQSLNIDVLDPFTVHPCCSCCLHNLLILYNRHLMLIHLK